MFFCEMIFMMSVKLQGLVVNDNYCTLFFITSSPTLFFLFLVP